MLNELKFITFSDLCFIKYKFKNNVKTCQLNLTCDNLNVEFFNFTATKPIVKPIKYGVLRI